MAFQYGDVVCVRAMRQPLAKRTFFSYTPSGDVVVLGGEQFPASNVWPAPKSPDPIDPEVPPLNAIRVGTNEMIFQASDDRFYLWPSGVLY